MAGKICPNCGKFTFFLTPNGRECTKCGYRMIVPSNAGRGGRGSKCPNCNKYSVRENEGEIKCSSCGAKFKKPKDS